MYNIKNKITPIREVQKYLVIISQSENSLPHITVDGIYGDELRAAVAELQRIEGIEVTGLVDYKTFNSILNRYNALVNYKRITNKVYSPNDYPLARGDNNDSVLMLNAMLRILSDYYEFKKPNDESFFSNDTLDAVIYLKGIFGMERSATVGIDFIDILSSEILARQKFKKTL